ncbi:MAG TPA: response regulator transcription factor [Aggregatilineales bacterium]|nr:response regulator transcription factor [Aggregatilineales bacterium]
MSKTILVVDDNRSVLQLVSDYLTENNFRVIAATNGREALFIARDEKPDLILLDIMMPVLDGYDFVRFYRKERETPIILLTAKLEESDKVIGLELGADDYVTKPFGMAELVARIRAVLRRSAKEALEPEMLRIGEIAVDRTARIVTVQDRPVMLTRSEFELLTTLMTTPERVFSRLDLLERLKGDSLEGVERSIDVHIRNLRHKIEPDPSHPQYILTIFGVGYRFVTDREWAAR